MKNKLKIGLTVLGLALFFFNMSFNIEKGIDSATSLTMIKNMAYAGTGECSLKPGDPVSGTSCIVDQIILGADWWWYSFNTATCVESCSAGGSSCCFDLRK